MMTTIMGLLSALTTGWWGALRRAQRADEGAGYLDTRTLPHGPHVHSRLNARVASRTARPQAPFDGARH